MFLQELLLSQEMCEASLSIGLLVRQLLLLPTGRFSSDPMSFSIVLAELVPPKPQLQHSEYELPEMRHGCRFPIVASEFLVASAAICY